MSLALACRYGLIIACLVIAARPSVARSAEAPTSSPDGSLFRRDNLIAWCIVPFDGKKRGPEERAAMLARLGFKHFAYDFRAEHVPTFDAEIAACKKHGVSFDAWWFPSTLNDSARHILEVCKRNEIHPELWVSGGGAATATPEEQRERVEKEAARIRPIAEAAAAQNMKVGLYNHGGWFGEPENQLAIIEKLGLANVGIIYNLHHGHDHVARLQELLAKVRPHLLCVNLNGMVPAGDKRGAKILQLGQGSLDLELLKAIRASGYRGRIGIIGHTNDDAEARLQDNLDGLDWLMPQLDGAAPGPKPQPRTPVPNLSAKSEPSAAVAPATGASGWLVAGRGEYRTPPLSLACRVTLSQQANYNILVACDAKRSAAHWELFSMPKSGTLSMYLPGYEPDHVHTNVAIADGRPHDVALAFGPAQVRLYVDGKLAAEQSVRSCGRPTVAGDFAIGRTVEGTIGSVGKFEFVLLARGIREGLGNTSSAVASVDANTIGFWQFSDLAANEIADASPLKNPARRSQVAASTEKPKAPTPSPGVHLKPVDGRLKATLVDRSPSDVYMGVKVDATGTIFVGGREKVFVFEPNGDGGYRPRRELLKFPPDSIIMGLEFRGDDLYVLTDNALYLVPQSRVRRGDLQSQRILWGLPLDLHVSFHCLAWGPDGDLYVTHGDPLLNYGDWNRADHWGHWTLYAGAENRPVPYTGQGAVLRMKPDGSDVRVVARGLRGPVGLAFDRAGNLFTNDNDHESRADRYAPSRLLHVVEGIDFGWPRGWMASKSPERFDLVEPMCNLGRGVPCDLLYYDHGLLAGSIGPGLLLCRWDRRSVTRYEPRPRGRSFTADEETVLVGDDECRPVGIAADATGRLYVTALYMAGNMAAPDCVSDLVVIEPKDPATMPVANHAAAAEKVANQTTVTTSSLDDARSDDTYRRQLGVKRLAETSSLEDLGKLALAADEPTRLAAVLAVGRRLTVPDPHSVPPSQLALSYPKGSSFFHRSQRFYGSDQVVDLADLGPIGSYTTAQWWAAIERSSEQERLFQLLVARLDDSSDRVRLQAAYYLSLLNDERSEAAIAETRRDVELQRLQAAKETRIERAWFVGPFEDHNDAHMAKPHEPEEGNLDLTASYAGRTWTEKRRVPTLQLPGTKSADARSPREFSSSYLHFAVQSGSRQTALLAVRHSGAAKLWLNTTIVDALAGRSSEYGEWLVDLQPGGNDFLLRLQHAGGAGAAVELDLLAATVRTAKQVEATLPEKLDSALLAERLRSAAAAGTSQTVAAEFLSIDWAKSSTQGDAAEGKRLFGSLGCAKCHAVVPDQRSAGAPSLFEARRRFTIPHLVESVLLPSRQVAEPFRAQTFVTTEGQTITGLVTAETDDAVELLLPDATRPTLAKRRIEERAATTLSPMPQGLVKTPDELRHLLAYLWSDAKP
jgi:putative heme-binding domain-containing protein